MAGPRENSAPKRWLSVADLEEYLGVSRSAIYHRVSERAIPFTKIPGSNLLRFDRLRIDAWMQSGEVETLTENLEGGDSCGCSPPPV